LTTLVALLRDHRDAVEADLVRFYGVDIAAYYRGELSPRRLSVLLHHLPPDAATHAARSGIAPDVTLQALVVMDLYTALTGEQHPARPTPKKASRYADLRKRLEGQRERLPSPPPAATA